MSGLIVVGFKNDKYRASDVLNHLRRMERQDWTVDLDDAVAVYRDGEGKLRIDQSYDPTTGDGAAWGGLWGSLIGFILTAPFTGGMSAVLAAGAIATGLVGGGVVGAAAGAVDTKFWKEDFGISDEFVKGVGEAIKPGDSAIFALDTGNPVAARKQFSGYDGEVITTTLSNEQAAKIEKVLDQGRRQSRGKLATP